MSTAVALVLGGGVAYTVGAVVYAAKRPDPWPDTFGFHEVFHLLTVIGGGLHLVEQVTGQQHRAATVGSPLLDHT